MPLPTPEPRDELHSRQIDLRGYRRTDGLYDIEARLIDTKSEALRLDNGRTVAPGEPIHDMSVRLVVDQELQVVEILASTDASPYGICREATATLQSVKGLSLMALAPFSKGAVNVWLSVAR